MSNTTTYKQTPIGLIPYDWEVKKLGDIGELKNGINKDKDDFGFGFPMVNLMDVFGINKVYKSNLKLGLVNANERDLKEYSLKKGDVLFVRSSVKPSGVGLTTLICDDLENTTYSGFIIRFRDDSYLNFEYKAHCFFEEEFRKRLLNKSTISANTNINQSALNSLLLPIPPLPEQQKIAQILSTWDAAIDNCKAIINHLKERNKGLAQQLLTGKIRVKGFEKTKWNEKKLGDVFKERNECNQNALQLLSIGERGVYPQDEDNKRDISNSDKSKYKKICVGDIGYNTMRMWQGRCAKSSYEGIVSPAYTIVFCKTNHFVNFYAHLFKLPFMMHKFFRVSQGLVEDTLNCKYKDFSIVSVNIPYDLEEQKAIVDILDTATAELNQYQQKLQTLQQQKKGLMQQLLTGKTRVKI